MTEPRLQSSFWVKACVRRADLAGISAVVARKGDPVSGAILLKINRRDLGCWVLSETRGPAGERAWFCGTGVTGIQERDADGYIQRHRERDPDLWVVEIEDREGRYPFDEPVMGDWGGKGVANG